MCMMPFNIYFQLYIYRFTIGDCAGGHRADNREKNRDVLCVPRKIIIQYIKCVFIIFIF